jgi:hypothetical protein
MKSKSAFQRKGRYFGWQLYTIVSTEDHAWGKSPGPKTRELTRRCPPSRWISPTSISAEARCRAQLQRKQFVLTSGFLNPT